MHLQRHLLAVAVAALVLPLSSHAQTQVQLGGQIKLGMDRTSYSGGTAAGPGSASRVTDNSSYWFVKGEEDLGGGNKAFFHLEWAFSTDSGTNGAARFNAVGLGGARWGRILLGQWSTYFASDSLLSPEGLSNATPYATGTLNVLGPIGARGQYFSGGFLPNTLRYESPRWGGVGVAASYSFDTETPGQGSNRTLNLNPTYVGDHLILYANHLARRNQPGKPGDFSTHYDQASTRLGAGYQFDSGFKAAVLWDRNSVEGNAVAGGKLSRDAWAIPLSYRVGPHLVSATYGRALASKTAGRTTPDTGASMLSLSYQHALSKRTTLATSISTVRNEKAAGYDFWHVNDTLATPAGYRGFSSRYLYVGVKHQF